MASLVCYLAVHLKNKLGWDDALDVWGVHGVGGVLGVILLGVFGTTAVNAAGANGLWHGGAEFFGKQVAAVFCTAAYAFVFSYAALHLINVFTPVKTTEKEEEAGMDEVQHGETAYLH